MVMWLGYVWCLSSFLAHAFLRTLHTRHLRVARTTPHKNKTPSQIGQTSLFVASWPPFTDAGCVAPVTDVFASFLITWSMDVSGDVSVHHVHCSSSFVFVGGFVCKRSVSYRERPSLRATRTL